PYRAAASPYFAGYLAFGSVPRARQSATPRRPIEGERSERGEHRSGFEGALSRAAADPCKRRPSLSQNTGGSRMLTSAAGGDDACGDRAF
ncbi:MAG: hypothetical protein LC808_12735, partial [Actinobacteria bacterium]|nr:hypothetical protein [Actinomycetota bacterium]